MKIHSFPLLPSRPLFGQIKLTQKVADVISQSKDGQGFLHELSFYLDETTKTEPKAEFKALESFLLLGFGLHLRVKPFEKDASKYQVSLEPIKGITPKIRSFVSKPQTFTFDIKNTGVLEMMRFMKASVMHRLSPKLLR